MPTLWLGNPQAIDGGQPLDGERITTAVIPDGRELEAAVRDVAFDDRGPNTGFWRAHSSAAAPSWVESDDPELATAVAEHYGCPVGRPTP